jgi:hypothetical protein
MFENIPEGMLIADFNRHPVRQMIHDAAYAGAAGLPTKAELDLLELPAAARASVRKHCREVAAIHDEGEHADAWARGDELAAAVLESLPEELREPDYAKPVALDPSLGPDELAALVGRS